MIKRALTHLEADSATAALIERVAPAKLRPRRPTSFQLPEDFPNGEER